MADRRHFEYGFIAATSAENHPISMKVGVRRKFWFQELSRDKVSSFCKFEMADGHHIGNSFLAISQRFIVRLMRNLV